MTTALALGAYSVHTSPEALAKGEANIAEIGKRLRAEGRIFEGWHPAAPLTARKYAPSARISPPGREGSLHPFERWTVTGQEVYSSSS